MKIALVGNQNSGKTTLFNLLTGMNAKIGNWPGVTLEKKTGNIKNSNHEIVDLPGIYSLSPYSLEEDVARGFIFDEKPDVIINIVDATSLERSLYLTTQLLELDVRVIVALNMADVLEKKGIKIDIAKLERELGAKVVKISALKETGINELIREINRDYKVNRKYVYDGKIESAVSQIERLIDVKSHKRFIAVKLLERDERFNNIVKNGVDKISQELLKNYDTDLEEIIATERYQFIEKVKKEAVISQGIKESFSDKLDKVFLNKWLAFPIFITIMFLVYYLSVGVIGSFTVDWVSGVCESFGDKVLEAMTFINTSEWIKSLVVDGIIAGVGAVLGFIPQLIILFVCISILEATGYMSRIALLLDKLFRKIGLSGKSLIPFIVGSGCSVPGIMGARIIENEDERKMTTILTPFIPCSAKLPIIVLFASYFFGENAGLVSASLYFLSIAIIILSAMLMKKVVFKKTSSTYISELPAYKIPNLKYVVKDVFDKVIEFIVRAGSIILVCSIVIWFLLSFSFKFEYGVNIEESMLASIGKSISWMFYPMLGENSWGATVSAIQGLVAKEQVVSSMAVIAGLAEESNEIFGKGSIFDFFTASSAYAFMVFNLFSAPCIGAIGAMRRELGGKRKALKAVAYQSAIAWIFGTVVYQVGSRIETGIIRLGDTFVIGILVMAVVLVLIPRKKVRNCSGGCTYCKGCGK